jgi:hypothetical protein
MGLMDHRSTWRYRVTAPPEQCVQAFVETFTHGGGMVVKAKWDVSRTGSGAVATYAGRKGLGAVASAISRQAAIAEEGAGGSQVTFKVERQDGDRTVCAMWLSERGTRFGFTADAGFIRPYFRSMQSQLRKLDPTFEVARD